MQTFNEHKHFFLCEKNIDFNNFTDEQTIKQNSSAKPKKEKKYFRKKEMKSLYMKI
jgi:hypothetical protein